MDTVFIDYAGGDFDFGCDALSSVQDILSGIS